MMATGTFQFNPDRVARFEAESWKSYNDHTRFKLLRLVVSLIQEQYHIPFPVSLLAAFYTVRASAAWAPKEHKDENAIRADLEKFYRLALRYSGLKFDPAKVAELEFQYWVDHRRLVGQPDKTPFINTMTALHAAIFGLTLDQAKLSGERRVKANNVLDTITGHISPNPAADWLRCEQLLRECYGSLYQATHVAGQTEKVTA
jgi:hypothetical protein